MNCPNYSDGECRAVSDIGIYIPLERQRREYCLGNYRECVYFCKGRTDRRKFQRRNKVLICSLMAESQVPDSFTLDFSPIGARIVSQRLLTPGDRYSSLLFDVDKRPVLEVEMEVIWEKPWVFSGWSDAGCSFGPITGQAFPVMEQIFAA